MTQKVYDRQDNGTVSPLVADHTGESLRLPQSEDQRWVPKDYS